MRATALLFVCLPVTALAQTTGDGNAAAPAGSGALAPVPTLSAARLTSPIRIDGSLDDAAWAAAPVATDFRQVDPAEGQPASERTEVRVLYDDDALYFGARMYEREPAQIRAVLARRDEPIWNGDMVQVYIDSYNTKLSGHIFRITPAGAIRDAVWLGDRNQDHSWDAVWESATRIDSLGWTAEIRIPFSQLRYRPSAGEQTWGVQFDRIIARRGETSEFAFTPKRAARGAQRWATLVLRDLPRSRHLELLPYATTRAEYLNVATNDPFRDANEYQMNVGGDLKYGLTSGLTLSATVNPDFGQVEVDPARVNLTANELFFPERRPFFVEGADIFRYARASTFVGGDTPTIFHSRRVGRPPQRRIDFTYPFTDMPEEATIAGATKITGQLRRGLFVGLLDALTLRETASFQTSAGVRGTAPVEPRTNYFVGRVRQDFNAGGTTVGVIATAVNRDLADSALATLLRRDAYFVGIDLNHTWRQREYGLDASLGRSAVFGSRSAMALTQRSPVHYFQRPDLEADRFDPNRRSLYGTSWQLNLAKNTGRHWLGNVISQGVTPGLEVNDVGFHGASSYHRLSGAVVYKEDQPGRVFRNWLTGPFSQHVWNLDGDHTFAMYGWAVETRLLNFWSAYLQGALRPRVLDDRRARGGPLMEMPAAKTLELGFESDSRRLWTVNVNLDYENEDYGGQEREWNVDFTVRPRSALRISVSPSYEASRNPAQYIAQVADTSATSTYGTRYVFANLSYHELALVTRVDWTFSPALSLQMFVQPLIADGKFSDFKTLRMPRTFDFDRYRESDGTLRRDASGVTLVTPGRAINVGNPNFSSRSLLGNAVVRWEYRPGSALFFVWQQRRAGEDGRPGFVFARDVTSVFHDAPENVFAIKATYWIGR